MASVKITVNGVEHEVEGSGWLIDALNQVGADIPHFCYHPGLGPDGNCRMCQVEYVTDRGSRLGISCNQPVVDGLNVNTKSEPVLKQVEPLRAASRRYVGQSLESSVCGLRSAASQRRWSGLDRCQLEALYRCPPRSVQGCPLSGSW